MDDKEWMLDHLLFVFWVVLLIFLWVLYFVVFLCFVVFCDFFSVSKDRKIQVSEMVRMLKREKGRCGK